MAPLAVCAGRCNFARCNYRLCLCVTLAPALIRSPGKIFSPLVITTARHKLAPRHHQEAPLSSLIYTRVCFHFPFGYISYVCYNIKLNSLERHAACVYTICPFIWLAASSSSSSGGIFRIRILCGWHV